MSATTSTIEKKLITGKELLEMGDIGPCELIEGRIVKMSPTKTEHGRMEAKLSRKLGVFVEDHHLGEIMVGETGIYTRRNPDTVRGADILFISHERLEKTSQETFLDVAETFLDVAPELVIEILSPTDRWKDMRKKVEEYFAIGVNWVWIVEPKKKAIFVYTSATEMVKYEEGDIVTGEGLLNGFQLNLKEFFSRV